MSEAITYTTPEGSSRDVKLDIYFSAAEAAGIPHSRIHRFAPNQTDTIFQPPIVEDIVLEEDNQ